MLCAAIQTRLFELDLTLGKAGSAPALLRASCVAFGNVFIHPTLQFSPPKKEKMGIVFLSPKGPRGEIVTDWETLNLRGSEGQRCPRGLSVIRGSCMESDAPVSLIQKQMCEMCSYIFFNVTFYPACIFLFFV